MVYVGIDLGGTGIKVGLVDGEGRVLAKKSAPTGAGRSEDAIIEDMARTASALVREYGLSWDEIDSIGIGTPGSVETDTGVVLAAGNLGFRNTPLAEKMGAYFSKPIRVNNDAKCAAWAEAVYGAAAGASCAVMVTLGTGIGGGIVWNGQIYGGFNGFGGEVGHMVIHADGEPCSCGKRGCFETYASATALIRDTRRAAEQNRDSLLWSCAEREGKFSGRTAFEAAKLGDAVAQSVVERYIRYLALGLVNIIEIFQPQVVVIGGGVSHEGATLFEPLTEQVMKAAYGDHIPPHKRASLSAACLGNDAGIIGAALLGRT